MEDKDLARVEDDYDLIALVGKFMRDRNISDKAKDSIKEIVRESFNLGFEKGMKSRWKE